MRADDSHDGKEFAFFCRRVEITVADREPRDRTPPDGIENTLLLP